MSSRKPFLILASASPRRRDLLVEHGYDFRVVPAEVEEVAPDFLTVGETVLFNADKKAAAVAKSHAELMVVGVDTLVALDGIPLGKPKDLGEAAQMLRQLSGRSHEVFSGVSIHGGGKRKVFVEVSRVTFRRLNETEIRQYMEMVKPLDKAGAYAAQENVLGVIESITGSRANVIGLPMEALERALLDF